MSGPARYHADRRRDRLGSHSPMHRSRNSSSQPSHRDTSSNLVAGAPQQTFESTSVAEYPPWPIVAMQVTAPSRAPSPTPPVAAPSVSPTPSTMLAGLGSQMTTYNNRNSVNNSTGCTIVNNNNTNNSFMQVVFVDDARQAAEDLNTVEKGLGQLHVPRAVYDAQPPTAGCMEGTRVELLQNTKNLLAFRGGVHIVWIVGMAGTGKTSVALTLCRRLVEASTVLLGGTFFCSRSSGMIDLTDAQRIIPTLATLLARQLPEYAQALAAELRADPDLASKAVTVQVERLLLRPLKSVRRLDKQIVFVIDALDECADQGKLTGLIDALAAFEMAPLNHHANRVRLVEVINALADFNARSLRTFSDQAKARLAELIDALAELKSTSLDNRDHRARLEELIDALVEFKKAPLNDSGDWATQAKLIDTLGDFRSTPPVKFLLTSRPEMHIRGTAITDQSLSSIVQLHMVEKEAVTSDIRLYIRKTIEMSSRSLTWYTDRDIDDLAALSAGLFIFASTVLGYILRRKDRPGRLERLRTVMMQTSASAIATDPLDRMYSLVLMQAADPTAYEPTELNETRRIVAIILTTRSPLTIKELAELLGLSPQHLRGALDELHAVLLVPEQDDDGELRTLHASFGDFFFTRAPEHIRMEKGLGHDELARACLQRMAADDLCFNVSCSRSSYEPNPEIPPSGIRHSLIYACHNWAHHIHFARRGFELDTRIFILKFLFWLEVLSVRANVQLALKILNLAAKLVTSPIFSQFLRDAKAFVLSFREAIQRSAPHIYLSAVAFTPKDSLVYQMFCSHLTGIPKIETCVVDNRLDDRTIRALNPHGECSLELPVSEHTGGVLAVAISRDGRLVASAAADGSVRVWNSQTCQQTCPPLLGHKDIVRSVAFSSDGCWIATGSVDTTLRLWDAQTGRSTMPELRGHTYSVSAIAFSPDDYYLASGSHDATIRVWKVVTGQPAEVSHIQCRGSVLCLAYSPSGELIAVGGEDEILQIFNVGTGQETRTCAGPGEPASKFHTPQHSITSLAFSPDGTQIVATVGISAVVFEVQTGHKIMEFHSCTSKVNAIANSPDGQFIASSAKYGAVRLWSSNTNQYVERVLCGHVDVVSSVAVSSTGRLLVTGSWDKILRIWDLEKIRPLAAERSCSPLASLALAQYEKSGDEVQWNGWLVSPSGELLLWIPREHRGYLEIGDYSRVIAPRRVSISVDDGMLHRGDRWTRCWRAPTS